MSQDRTFIFYLETNMSDSTIRNMCKAYGDIKIFNVNRETNIVLIVYEKKTQLSYFVTHFSNLFENVKITRIFREKQIIFIPALPQHILEKEIFSAKNVYNLFLGQKFSFVQFINKETADKTIEHLGVKHVSGDDIHNIKVLRIKFPKKSDAPAVKNIVAAALSEVKSNAKGSLSGGKGMNSGDSKSKSSDSGSKDLIKLTDSNFDDLVLDSEDIWLVQFFLPRCGYCKNLAPEWEKAASELKGKVKLGALDAIVHQSKAQEYGVQSYPSIKFFHGGRKDRGDATDYTGGRTASDIVTWALDKYSDNIAAPEVIELTSNGQAAPIKGQDSQLTEDEDIDLSDVDLYEVDKNVKELELELEL